MIIKRDTIFVHKDDIERVLMDKLPGHIADFSRGSQWPGCRIVTFGGGFIDGLPEDVLKYIQDKTPAFATMNAAEHMNNFFMLFANYYVASWSASDGEITVMYSSILDEEDSQDLSEVSGEIRKEMNAKRAARKAVREAAELQAKADMDEIIRLGRLAKENPDMVSALEARDREISELKLDLKRATRKAKKA
jgi:hypothetical protein